MYSSFCYFVDEIDFFSLSRIMDSRVRALRMYNLKIITRIYWFFFFSIKFLIRMEIDYLECWKFQDFKFINISKQFLFEIIVWFFFLIKWIILRFINISKWFVFFEIIADMIFFFLIKWYTKANYLDRKKCCVTTLF